MDVVAGSASKVLAPRIAEELAGRLVPVEARVFPDGERYVRVLEPVDRVVLVQNTYPDGNLVEFLLWVDALREAGASWVAGVVPYMSYARQDKVFLQGEALSIRAVTRSLQPGLDAFVTVDAHNTAVMEHLKIPAVNASGAPAIARHLKGRVDSVLAPDEGAVDRVRELAEILGVPWDYLEKSRHDAHNVEIKPKRLAVDDKAVAIVDDVISTGGTIVAAAKALKANGAARVVAACTHGLFADGALKKLDVCDEIVSTDTVESPTTRTTVAPEVAQAISRLE